MCKCVCVHGYQTRRVLCTSYYSRLRFRLVSALLQKNPSHFEFFLLTIRQRCRFSYPNKNTYTNFFCIIPSFDLPISLARWIFVRSLVGFYFFRKLKRFISFEKLLDFLFRVYFTLAKCWNWTNTKLAYLLPASYYFSCLCCEINENVFVALFVRKFESRRRLQMAHLHVAPYATMYTYILAVCTTCIG